MGTTQLKPAIAFVGVLLLCAGLVLAALSNPSRFSLDRATDQQIRLLMISGFACTIAGVMLLLTAGSSATKHMQPEKKRNTNIGVGIGLFLQLAGLLMYREGGILALYCLLFVLLSLPAFVWGCMNYAEGKGQPKWVGVVGVAGIVGLIVLIVLPAQPQDGPSGKTTDKGDCESDGTAF